MMELGRSSLDFHDLGRKDAFLGGFHGSYISGNHRHMIGSQDLFDILIVSNSGIYVELGMRTKHVE